VYLASTCIEVPRSVSAPATRWAMDAYQTARSSLVCRLSGDLEGDVVGSGVLDLEGRGRGVVEVLSQELQEKVNPGIEGIGDRDQ
jgi:hypothetical protein